MTSGYRIRLAKEDFKFSVAHFTVFSADSAEVLHGHNYRVRVAVTGDRTDELGLLLDVRRVKNEVRRLCSSLDGLTLVPTDCSRVSVEAEAKTVQVRFRGLEYSFPASSVLLLPLSNTSIEELARWFWSELAPTLAPTLARRLEVDVEETSGQSCSYVADLPE
jgi:6-pyruvoyltetrahydropterin/6-carboxytetrahydropterin synthase